MTEIKPRYEQDNAMLTAMMSEQGQKLISSQGGMFFDRDPLCSSFSSLQSHIAGFPLPEIAETKAPLPEDPRILSRHIKSLGYFLGADMVGICKLPTSSIYRNVLESDGENAMYENAVILLNVKKIM